MDDAVDRRNGNRYLWANLMSYLAAPVYYVDVTQAALFTKLGASAFIANLPASVNLIGNVAPIVFACLVPHRWERRMSALPSVLIAIMLALVSLVLILPLDNQARIIAVLIECLFMGVLNSVMQLYLWQCLVRGTSEVGCARALKLTFSFGPLAAVAGSLGTQFILRGGIPGLAFPHDFALVHFYGVPCAAFAAWQCSRFELRPLADGPRTPFFPDLWASIRDYGKSRVFMVLFAAFFIWNCALYSIANLSLYTQQAMHRDPAEFSGIILALRFGCKAIAGFGLGVLNMRYGFRAPLIATVAFIALAMVWPLVVPGYGYLGAFGLMGAGELAGAYFPNVVMVSSPLASATRNLSLLNMATPLSGPAPALYGYITDHYGFRASFLVGTALALIALWLVFQLPTRKPRAVVAD
jgi:hypothetical protein